MLACVVSWLAFAPRIAAGAEPGLELPQLADRAVRIVDAGKILDFVHELEVVLPDEPAGDAATLERMREAVRVSERPAIERPKTFESSLDFQALRMRSLVADVVKLLTRIQDRDLDARAEMLCWAEVAYRMGERDIIRHDLSGLGQGGRLVGPKYGAADIDQRAEAFAYLWSFMAQSIAYTVVMPYLAQQGY